MQLRDDDEQTGSNPVEVNTSTTDLFKSAEGAVSLISEKTD